MPRLSTLIAAIALSLYGVAAFPQAAAPAGSTQAAAPPTAQPVQDAAGTSDEAITKAIQSALDADPHHFFRHVTVRVDNGVATLSGFVHTSQAINRARTIAGNVPGVTRVVSNNLSLEPNRPR
ncbi:MAG: BON domain-containing protein [Sinobacteraceae bacterium]|nr:BON domain-containing protein [Nevskiaceae bacterium]